MTSITIYFLCLINILCFILGLLVGKIYFSSSVFSEHMGYSFVSQEKKKKEQNKVINKIKSIDIDESTYVINENTDGLEKKFENIADTKSVSDNIESSVNKLSQMIKG